MRRAWLTTFGAALCAASITTSSPAEASPSGMTLGVHPVASSSTDESWTDKLQFWKDDEPTVARVASPAKPSDEISPWRHPITYFSAAVSEMPGASVFKGDKKAEKAPDKLSLETPIAPATPQYYIALAQVAERQGQPAAARTQLQQALAKWPRDVDLLRAAARLEDRQGNLPTAEMLYNRAVAANPQHAGAHNDLGLCLARQGKFNEAVQSIEQAINLQPDKSLYRNNAATVLVEMHQDQRALAHLSAVHSSADANFNIGQLLVDRGRPHEAYSYFQHALELDPSMQAAQDAIAKLNGAPTPTNQFAAEPTIAPQVVAPNYGPQFAPQQPSSEPTFPATARGPALNSSSYVQPGYYYPATQMQVAPQAAPQMQAYQPPQVQSYPAPTVQAYQAPQMQVAPAPVPQTPVYQTATVPRYLPPVQQASPQTMVR
ncbi:MAG: tetratricopeptide repeat protein [Pirellulales bacterium]